VIKLTNLEVPKKKEIKKIFYFASTHWDREWYRSFQGFRYRLVKTTNGIIDTLIKDEEFHSFIFDGQTVVLEDYCEIEPDKRECVRQLVKEGRLKIGPWYVMPDEFLVSGESLIRNLMLGHKTASEFGGEAMKYGYICDIFGHIAQMPQIFNGFNIKGALLGRGTNYHTTDMHFRWQALDGSECITFKVPENCGYGSFWLDVWLPYILGEDLSLDSLVSRAVNYIDSELERSNAPFIVLMDGMDHEAIHELAPYLVEKLKEHYGCPVVFEALDSMVLELEKSKDTLSLRRGELNDTAKEVVEHNMLITHTLSSRYDLKKANDETQILIEKWAEPYAALANLRGYNLQKTYIDKAYNYLIKNHPHDSICGCSIDEVHSDMHYRFRQAKAICTEVINDAMYSELSNTARKNDSSEYVLSLFNSMPFDREEVVTAKVNFKMEYKNRFAEQAPQEFKNAFMLIDHSGREIPYTLVDVYRGEYVNVLDSNYCQKVDSHTITFKADMKAFSKTEYKLVPSKKPTRYLGRLSTGYNTGENKYIRMSINDNGTIDIYDKATGRNYSNLLSYVSDGEIGDGWFHVNPTADRAISSTGFPSSIERVYDGQDSVCFRVTTYMRLPEGVNNNTQHWLRSEATKELKIITYLTLTSTSKFVEVKTQVLNNIKDHRLRLCVPTGINSEHYSVSQAFGFVERKVGIDYSTSDWKEHEKYEKQFENIVYKRIKDGSGIAFISTYGLHECGALDDERGSLIITLYRSFSKTFLTNGEPDGQLLKPLEFSYRIIPLSEEDKVAELIRIKDSLQAGIRYDSFAADESYEIKESQSYFTLEGSEVIMSILKLPEAKEKSTVIARFVSYSNKPSTAVFACWKPILEAYETNMLEEVIAPLAVEDKEIKMSFRPWEIKTVKLKIKL
jgi:alpha-mannosidase